MIYADADYYRETYGGTAELTAADLRQASEHIDILTYNRIEDFDALTEYQQTIIKNSACKLAEFEHDNADIIAGGVASYSLNGASVSFGGVAVTVVNGVYVRNDIYAYLRQCGLCTGVLK